MIVVSCNMLVWIELLSNGTNAEKILILLCFDGLFFIQIVAYQIVWHALCLYSYIPFYRLNLGLLI